MWRCGIKFAGICIHQSADSSCKLYAGCLHAEADAEIWDVIFTRVADRLQHAFNAALAKAAGNKYAVEIAKLFVACLLSGFEPFSFNPTDSQLQVVSEGPVNQRFFQRLV